MKCPRCGTLQNYDAVFCNKCGTPLYAQGPAPDPVDPEQEPVDVVKQTQDRNAGKGCITILAFAIGIGIIAWFVSTLGGMSPRPTPTPWPTVTVAPTTRPVLAFEKYVKATYDEYARNPTQHIDDPIQIFGEVLQVIDGTDGEVTLRIAQDTDYDTVWLVTYKYRSNQSRILVGDVALAIGRFYGLTQYESTMGGQITVPWLDADNIVSQVAGG